MKAASHEENPEEELVSQKEGAKEDIIANKWRQLAITFIEEIDPYTC